MGISGFLSEVENEMGGGSMITKLADNILSPLGMTSEENFEAVLRGESRLQTYQYGMGLPEDFCASLFDRLVVSNLFKQTFGSSANAKKYTFFEQLCILSVQYAIVDTLLSPQSKDVLFVMSTTKGNVDLLEDDVNDTRAYLFESARRVAAFFGNFNEPLVVSNACVSGVCAQIVAVRALLSGCYRHAVVVGCDVLSKFIVSGFQSFKALSPEPCKPYDKNRTGLNLGEAAGTIWLSTESSADSDIWQYVSSSNHNDANHISGPSRTGEGAFRVLSDILKDVPADTISFINAHGTATPYNDEMESIALHRAGLDTVPVNGFKGYYGHTLGAAGLIETILSMHAVDKGIIPATKGFEEPGTSYRLDISNQTRKSSKKTFIKILSGFGGTNAGIAYRKGDRA